MSGLQTGNITAGGEGGAYVGAAAAGLAAADARDEGTRGERPDPDRNENQISSSEADRVTADEPGYWRIAAPGEGPQPPAPATSANERGGWTRPARAAQRTSSRHWHARRSVRSR